VRFRETPQDSALRVDLQDAPSYGVAHIKDVVRRDDKATGMPYATFMVAMETTIVAIGMQGIGGQLGGFAY